jgi:hypothetical protein
MPQGRFSSSVLFRTVALGRLTYTSDGNVWYFIVCVGVWAIDEFVLGLFGPVILWWCGTPSDWSDCVSGSVSESEWLHIVHIAPKAGVHCA